MASGLSLSSFIPLQICAFAAQHASARQPHSIFKPRKPHGDGVRRAAQLDGIRRGFSGRCSR
jgi:hypothetical protein